MTSVKEEEDSLVKIEIKTEPLDDEPTVSTEVENGAFQQIFVKEEIGPLSSEADVKSELVLTDEEEGDCKKTFETTESCESSKYCCLYCKMKFSDRTAFDAHIRMHTENPLVCSLCDKQVIGVKCFLQHTRTHKKFSNKAQHSQHIATHSKAEKSLSCTICSKTFSVKKSLVRHMHMHELVTFYACSYCKKKFYHKANLTAHLRIHTENPFVCSCCDKKFVGSQDFLEHVRTHKTESEQPPGAEEEGKLQPSYIKI